jgi:hypothetical protein
MPIDTSQVEVSLMGYEKGKSYPKRSQSAQGFAPLAVCADPVAIADEIKQWDYRPVPQPDQYSPETIRGLCRYFNYGWHSIYKRLTDESWLTSFRRLTDQEIFEWWLDPNALIGLGFDTKTRYFLIDIDNHSQYHNEDGLRRIRAALASMGIYKTILYRSSHSGGWHLLCPLPEAVNTFKLSQVISIKLAEHDLEIKGGQLEIFPNKKSFSKEKYKRFNRHRLPFQDGSYLLDAEFQPVTNDLEILLELMDQAAACVDCDRLSELLEKYHLLDCYQYREKVPPIDNVVVSLKWFRHSKDVKRWREESLEAIKAGWLGHHQSNYLLGVIAEYGRVFLRIDDERELAAHVVKTAIACPGYFLYCRHQNEIEAWALRWAKCAMIHRYPIGTRSRKPKKVSNEKKGLTNEEKTALAQLKLIEGVEDLSITNRLEKGVKAREKQLTHNLGISKSTLWKEDYLSLWHPKHMIAHKPIETQSQQAIHGLSPHPSEENCVELFPPFLSATISEKEREQILNHQGIEGSDPIINQIPFPEIDPQVIDQECDRTPSEMNFARFSSLKTSEPVDLQAFKTRKETENRRLQPMLANPVFPRQKTERTEAVRSPKKEILTTLKVGDRVYHIDRPSYGLTIKKIINDELVKAETDGFKGSESFAICELRLLGNIQLEDQRA